MRKTLFWTVSHDVLVKGVSHLIIFRLFQFSVHPKIYVDNSCHDALTAPSQFPPHPLRKLSWNFPGRDKFEDDRPTGSLRGGSPGGSSSCYTTVLKLASFTVSRQTHYTCVAHHLDSAEVFQELTHMRILVLVVGLVIPNLLPAEDANNNIDR